MTSGSENRKKKPRDQMVGRSVVVLTAVFHNQDAIDKLDEAIEYLRQLHHDMPWLGANETIEKLIYTKGNIDGIA